MRIIECPNCRNALKIKMLMQEKGRIALPETEDEGYPSTTIYQCPNCKNIEILE